MRIFLIGFMGSGKTHWGRIWSETSGMDFYDLDEMIETAEKQTIDHIFSKKGESYFRKKEAALLRGLVEKDNCIIACGGGTPCYDDNIEWMNAHGTTVFLEANPARLLENVLLEYDKRPLIKRINKGELLFFIEQKLNERDPFYHKANLTLNVSQLEKKSIEKILDYTNKKQHDA